MSNTVPCGDTRSAAVKAVVIANGALPDLAPFRALLDGTALVVAADGGARAVLEAGLPLTTVVGDMDSLPPPLLRRWQESGGETVRFPPAKDETDLELALRHAYQHGARRITVLGALGGRVDHTMANLLLLAAPWLDGTDVAALDVQTRIVAVRSTVALHGEPGDLLSLLPLTAQAEGIYTDGLLYPLRGESLMLGSPRGVSNVFVDSQVSVRLAAGTVLAIQSWSGQRRLGW